MSNPNALLLLADHIKLSLLERQRAKTLNLASDSQDGHISKSLDQFRDGLEALQKEVERLQEAGDAKATHLESTLSSLQKQYGDLTSQFHGFSSTSSSAATLTSPNDPSLAADFAHATSTTSPRNSISHPPITSALPSGPKRQNSKTVRFSEAPSTTQQEEPDLEAGLNPSGLLFPYRDDPTDEESSGYHDRIAGENLSNVQIHEYHRQILEEQDAQLDALGASISRQRELSMRIGDELDEQVLMLDEADAITDRHQSRLDRATRQMGRVIKKGAGEHKQVTAIVILIIILVLLIIILK
ncbi:hypothetical protein QBC46DRAFT_377476 [Diplogelasinospora grovesii]|uniref:t-SNARE coiled-coil homology domain-containing protein n=1 Tax=Diplogelasinospora grovesii TaxID=303347 RepID=A0AAN6ND48_9PEZI|nr:hypothetical protein QBC46DRAFT_377476 [Diplogelasinospora grovesii]